MKELTELAVQSEWDSFLSSINHWVETLSVEVTTFKELVEGIHHFAYQYKSYFENDIYENSITAANTTRFKVLQLARQALINEWDKIRTALEQRGMKRYQDCLNNLDNIAKESLDPILPSGKQPITYFNSSYNITRFVFSDVPLIGIPFSALHLPIRWLSVPHEAGHYIFWNGAQTMEGHTKFHFQLEKAVIAQLNDILQEPNFSRNTVSIYATWLNWLEELFADIYSTLVAGPASGWGMQAYIVSHFDEHDLEHNDEKHPTPYLRPFIHIATLRYMAELSESLPFKNVLNKAAEAQESAWRQNYERLIEQFLVRGSLGEEVLEKDLPNIVKAIIDSSRFSQDESTDSLAQLFQNSRFYTLEKHEQIQRAADTLQEENPNINSLSALGNSIASMLAIIDSTAEERSKTWKRVNETFACTEEKPHEVKDLAHKDIFEKYVLNVTGSKDKRIQRKTWHKILEASLSATGAHGGWAGSGPSHHHHPHSHYG